MSPARRGGCRGLAAAQPPQQRPARDRQHQHQHQPRQQRAGDGRGADQEGLERSPAVGQPGEEAGLVIVLRLGLGRLGGPLDRKRDRRHRGLVGEVALLRQQRGEVGLAAGELGLDADDVLDRRGVVEEDLDPVDAALLGLDPDVDVEDLSGHVRGPTLGRRQIRDLLQLAHGVVEVGGRYPQHHPGAEGVAVLVRLGVVLGDGPAVDVDDLADVEDRLADVVGPELDVAGRDHPLLLDRGPAGGVVAAGLGRQFGDPVRRRDVAVGCGRRLGRHPAVACGTVIAAAAAVVVGRRGAAAEQDEDGRGSGRERRAERRRSSSRHHGDSDGHPESAVPPVSES